jgi:hypothetical protein
MSFEVKHKDKFRFLEEGEGEPLVLLHGLFGALSNFENLIDYFRQHNKVIVPILPLFELDILHSTVGVLQNSYIFLKQGYKNTSSGKFTRGTCCLIHVLKHPES